MSTLLVAAAILESEGCFLLTRRKPDRPYPHLWEFPGGKVEPGEDPKDAVAREIREELGIQVAVETIYEALFHRYPERDVLILAYRCRWVRGEVQDLDVAEHAWVCPHDMMRLDLLEADIPLAQKILKDAVNENPADI